MVHYTMMRKQLEYQVQQSVHYFLFNLFGKSQRKHAEKKKKKTN